MTNNWWKQLDMNSSQPKPANSLQSNLQEALTGSNLKAALSGSKPKPGGIGSNLQAALTGSNLKAFRGSNLQAALSGSNLQAALSMPKKNMADMSQQVTQPMTCNKCGKMFLTKEHLEKHMLVHNAGWLIVLKKNIKTNSAIFYFILDCIFRCEAIRLSCMRMQESVKKKWKPEF